MYLPTKSTNQLTTKMLFLKLSTSVWSVLKIFENLLIFMWWERILSKKLTKCYYFWTNAILLQKNLYWVKNSWIKAFISWVFIALLCFLYFCKCTTSIWSWSIVQSNYTIPTFILSKNVLNLCEFSSVLASMLFFLNISLFILSLTYKITSVTLLQKQWIVYW